jgi:hypothetical protein
VKLYDAVWVATGGIVLVAIATKTDVIKNLLAKIKNPQGFYYNYNYGYGPSWYGFNPLVQEQYPSHILSTIVSSITKTQNHYLALHKTNWMNRTND